MLGKKGVYIIEGDEVKQHDARIKGSFTLEDFSTETDETLFDNIGFLIIEDEDGAELLEVNRWTRRAEKKGDHFTKVLELGFSRSYGCNKNFIKLLKPHINKDLLSPEGMKKVDDILFNKVPIESPSDSCNPYQLSLSEAKAAVANYYRVDKGQVMVTITSDCKEK